MFTLVLLIYLFLCAEKMDAPCLILLSVRKASDRKMHFDFNIEKDAF